MPNFRQSKPKAVTAVIYFFIAALLSKSVSMNFEAEQLRINIEQDQSEQLDLEH
ncbi:hypothetical protein [Leptothoe spongobia]|uniref:Uncharacterized protein n=1 Tax=Leptothoe spongobia TAU-MAC 1115 TaxID=1967444 RepID=A0A947GML3_9CYAN|nr:hypothetical protein [Leptothoe spongobia]MBT9317742.1 hypothetical protein [Leptothoe spongobia TAU-MAC 1115]